MKKTIYASVKIIFRDFSIIAVTLAFLGMFNYVCAKELIRTDMPPTLGNFFELKTVLSLSFYCFIFFAFIAFYLAGKTKHTAINDTLEGFSSGLRKLVWSQIMLFAVAAFILMVNAFGYILFSAVLTNVVGTEAFRSMIGSIVLYIFGVSVCAILCGYFIGFCFKRVVGYIILFVWCIIISPVMQYMVETLYYSMDINIFGAFEFICIFPRSLNVTPNHFIGYSVTVDRIISVLFFILLPAILLVLHIERGRRKLIQTLILCSVSLGCFIAYCLPMARNVSDRNPNAAYVEEIDYYYLGDEIEQKSQNGGFIVESYDIDLKIGLQLDAIVSMTFDVNNLESYIFTLYHNYKVNNVYDQDKNRLKFIQDGDYITVWNENGEIKSVTMEYSGANPTYYANYVGISLPGHFAFYPRSGFQYIYDNKTQGYYPNLLSEPAYFNINVNYNKKVYCNLAEGDKKNTFSGYSDGITLMAGFLQSETYNDVEVIYPYMDSEQFYNGRALNDIELFLQQKKDDRIIRKIIMLPVTNSRNVQCVYYSDGTIVCVQPRTLSMYYDASKIQTGKRKLYELCRCYENESDFYNRLAYEKLVYTSDECGLAQLFIMAVDKHGTDNVMKAVEEYLLSDNDSRDERQFLEDIINE